MGPRQPADEREPFSRQPVPCRRVPRRPGGGLRAGRIRGLGSGHAGEGARRLQPRLPRPVHAHHADPPDVRPVGRVRRARFHDPQRRGDGGRPRPFPHRQPHRHRSLAGTRRTGDPRDRVRRRDEEGGVHPHALAAARPRHPVDALRRQRRAGIAGGRGAVLRPLGHRQDDALRRPAAASDRRRRAWLGGHGGVQRRRGVLREVHPAVGRARTGDLSGDPLRHRSRERRRRRGVARSRLRLGGAHREHAGGVPDRFHRQRQDSLRRRSPAERDLSHLRRVGSAASGEPPVAAAGDVPLPVRLHGPCRRHGDGGGGAAGCLLRLFFGRVPGARSGGLRPPARRPARTPTTPARGW